MAATLDLSAATRSFRDRLDMADSSAISDSPSTVVIREG